MKDTVSGFFEYVSANDGWQDSFRVVDDDGMPFCLTDLRKQFDGRAVTITIELNTELESMAGFPEPPAVYRSIGLTAENYKIERLKRQSSAQ